MGETVVYHCQKCGKDHYISIGGGYIGFIKAESVLSGEYGIQAKRNIEKHPGKLVTFSFSVFRCSCGYVRSKNIMQISDDTPLPGTFEPRMRVIWNNARCKCPRCKKSMSIAEDFPRKIRCNCGSWIENFDLYCIFD